MYPKSTFLSIFKAVSMFYQLTLQVQSTNQDDIINYKHDDNIQIDQKEPSFLGQKNGQKQGFLNLLKNLIINIY